MTSALIVAAAAFCLTSMSGDSAVTCTSSVTLATVSVRSILRIWPSCNSMFSTLASPKLCRMARTSYTPGVSAGNR